MNNLLGNLLLAVAFFTRIPVPERNCDTPTHDTSLADAVVFFPAVGLLIGSVSGGVWFLSVQVFPPLPAAGLAILFGTVLTGALHEDGLADCADGIAGGKDRKKILEIMRDSRIGTYGAIALVTSLGLRWTGLASLSASDGFAALLIAHTVSRAAIILAMQFSTYARPKGLGAMATGELGPVDIILAFAVAVVSSVIFGQLPGLVACLVALALAFAFLKFLERRIGGYTGDGLGAMQQIAEISVLIILAGAWA